MVVRHNCRLVAAPFDRSLNRPLIGRSKVCLDCCERQ